MKSQGGCNHAVTRPGLRSGTAQAGRVQAVHTHGGAPRRALVTMQPGKRTGKVFGAEPDEPSLDISLLAFLPQEAIDKPAICTSKVSHGGSGEEGGSTLRSCRRRIGIDHVHAVRWLSAGGAGSGGGTTGRSAHIQTRTKPVLPS